MNARKGVGENLAVGTRTSSEAWKSRVSELANAKPKSHQTTLCRARQHEWKDPVLTQGDPLAERLEEVSRSHSSDEAPRKRGRAKGRRTMEQSSMRSWRSQR